MSRFKKLTAIAVTILVLVVLIGLYIRGQDQSPTSPPTSNTTQNDTETSPPETFNKQLHSLSDPLSIWVIVNKKRPLPDGYIPPDLRTPEVPLRLSSQNEQMKLDKRAAAALKELFAAADAEGHKLVLSSGYRSEALQRQFYTNYAARDGSEAADRYSARPGYSEHQTGLVADLMNLNDDCHLAICFGDLPEGKWLAANAHTYGFIVRYPDGKEAITGYQYEPWHFRFVGKELAGQIHSSNLTLEEFFELSPATNY